MKAPTPEEIIFQKKVAEEVVKQLADQGMLMEFGFSAFRKERISPNASEFQLREMRMAFMAGASHLFCCILSILDPGAGAEPTAADSRRMESIAGEIKKFILEMKLRSSAKG